MNELILKQLFGQPQEQPRNMYFAYERSTTKIQPYQRSLFLRIFKEVRKKLKRGNQFDVAIQIKKIFMNAEQIGAFEYYSAYEYKLNPTTQRNEYVPIPNEEQELKKVYQAELRQIFLKQIGLTKANYRYLYGYFHFYDLAEYYRNATPGAIVQMKKRLKSLK